MKKFISILATAIMILCLFNVNSQALSDYEILELPVNDGSGYPITGISGEFYKNDEERYGKISNPTVHIALNQTRTVVNAIIKENL